MNRYETLRKNIIYEDKIYYKKNDKQYIGCLIKSKYADQSDQIEFYLFENKSTKDLAHRFDLINYDCCREQKKDNEKKTFFFFELIPKHQQFNEIFGCKTEDDRIKWIRIFNENIDKLNINHCYEIAPNLPDERLFNDEEKNLKDKQKPVVPPRNINSKDGNIKSSKSDSLQSALIDQLNQVVLKSKKSSLQDDEIVYQGTIEELQKILFKINKSGVYAITAKVQPGFDCNLAIRVYENAHQPLSSWNIYQNEKTKKYFLFDDAPTFSTISQLCQYYTDNNLPSESSTINRLLSPYKHYLK